MTIGFDRIADEMSALCSRRPRTVSSTGSTAGVSSTSVPIVGSTWHRGGRIGCIPTTSTRWWRVAMMLCRRRCRTSGRIGCASTVSTAPGQADVRHAIVHVEDNLSNLRLIERSSPLAPTSNWPPRCGTGSRSNSSANTSRYSSCSTSISRMWAVTRSSDNSSPDPATASIPVIVLSADATRGQVERLLGAGAYAYLTKPVDVRQLINTIDTIIDTRRDH